MKRYITYTLALLALLCGLTSASAQEGRVVSNIEISNLSGKATSLPNFSNKHLLIFYVDPDRAGQNDEFIKEISDNAELKSGKFFGISVMNTKDAPMAHGNIAYKMAAKRAEATGTPFLIDQNATLSTEWRLGDCDNMSVIILVSTTGEILFVSKGRITDKNKERFYRVIGGL